MDKSEYAFRTLGKFLAVASITKAYTNMYKKDVPKHYLETIAEELTIILEEYTKIKVEDSKEDISKLWYSSEDEDYFSDWGVIPYDTNIYDEDDFLNDVGC